MHKCIPYAKIIVLRFVEPWWFMNLSERINPFPTHTLEHIPLGEAVKFRFADMGSQVQPSAAKCSKTQPGDPPIHVQSMSYPIHIHILYYGYAAGRISPPYWWQWYNAGIKKSIPSFQSAGFAMQKEKCTQSADRCPSIKISIITEFHGKSL